MKRKYPHSPSLITNCMCMMIESELEYLFDTKNSNEYTSIDKQLQIFEKTKESDQHKIIELIAEDLLDSDVMEKIDETIDELIDKHMVHYITEIQEERI